MHDLHVHAPSVSALSCLMISLIRWIGALLGIGTAMATVVMLPLWLFRKAWRWLWEVLGGFLPELRLPDDLTVLTQYPPLSWAGRPIPLPPDDTWVIATSIWILLPMIAMLALGHMGVSMNARIRSVCGQSGVRFDKGHPHQAFVDTLARRYGVGRIELRRLPVGGIIAFILSSPWRRHTIVLSDGILMLPPPMVQWVLAHEVAHARYGDTQSQSVWLLALRSIMLFDRLRHMAMNATLRMVQILPVLTLLTRPLHLLFRGLSLIGRAGRRVGFWIFVLFDRWASRRMEYRADRFAAEHVGTGPGIALFAHLVGQFEPTFDLFATHPPAAKRRTALERLVVDSGGLPSSSHPSRELQDQGDGERRK
ncbi:M48 family metallopeptidase [Halomonas sp. LBP4]|uniref:M48 family metallopeptidase n=1 Tax=Halomonas sp. LBP4 TaxID=2044917 RepID=UPI000D765DE0|nr:M48 family metalloprotease [Halomonas sp. LBP4]PXX94644.1 hypothetical protein CR157_21745 [Halomonas sp. LBP4]